MCSASVLTHMNETPYLAKALLIGDSLAVPRPKKGQPLDRTWPELLKNKFPRIDVWQRCRAGSMSDRVLQEFHLFSDSIGYFQFMVIQVGIGDCCPRPYPYLLHKAFETCGGQKLIKRINSWYPILMKFRSKPWISVETYLANLREIVTTALERNGDLHITVVAIGEPSHRLLTMAPGVKESQKVYNREAERMLHSLEAGTRLHFVNPYEMVPADECFIEDGHHLSVKGHECVANSISATWESVYEGYKRAYSRETVENQNEII